MKRSDVRFLLAELVHELHAGAIAFAGGDPGTRDEGLVDAAVNAPVNGYYGSLADMAAAYGHGLAKNHGFIDGNKRTAAYAVGVFLELNGFTLTFDSEPWIGIFEGVATGAVSRDELAEKIAEAIGQREGRDGPPMWCDLEPEEDGER